MTKFVSRLVAVDAMKLESGIAGAQPVMDWINGNGGKSVWCAAMPSRTNSDGRVKHQGLPESLRLRTPDGWQMVYLGDYVIRNPKGQFYKYDQIHFEELYVEGT